MSDLIEIEADHARARRFFIAWLIMATVLTLAGNAADAVVAHIDPLAVRLAVRLIPPTVALVALHGLSVLSRSGGKRRAVKVITGDTVFLLSLIITALVAITAAVLSYAGLYDLALSGGLRPRLAWLFPLTIDAEILVASVALVALRPASAADIRATREHEKKAKASTVQPSPQVETAVIDRPVTAKPTTDRRPAVVTKPTTDRCPATIGGDHKALADLLVTSGRVVLSAEKVSEILASSASNRRIAEAVGCSPTTVGNIRRAAAELLVADGDPARTDRPHLVQTAV